MLVRQLFSAEESTKLRRCIEGREAAIRERSYARKDDTGTDTRLIYCNGLQ